MNYKNNKLNYPLALKIYPSLKLQLKRLQSLFKQAHGNPYELQGYQAHLPLFS